MKVEAIRTPIVKPGEDLVEFFKKILPKPEEKSILVITSKIVSYAQNRLLPKLAPEEKARKHQFVREDADWYLEPDSSKYNLMLTIKNSLLAVNAGLDESNADGNYIFWPINLQEEVNKIWQELKTFYGLKEFGVIITDSRSIVLRYGVLGTAMAVCGFNPLNDRIGTKDIFGKKLEMTKINVSEGMAAAAVLEMGEGDEQRPVALISNIQQQVQFMDRPLNEKEIADLVIDPNEDVYAPVLMSVKWNKGGGGKKF